MKSRSALFLSEYVSGSITTFVMPPPTQPETCLISASSLAPPHSATQPLANFVEKNYSSQQFRLMLHPLPY